MSDSNVIYEWLVLICLLCASKAKLVKGCSPVAGNKHQYLYQHKSLSVAGTDIGSIFAVSDIPIKRTSAGITWDGLSWFIIHDDVRDSVFFKTDGRLGFSLSVRDCPADLVSLSWLRSTDCNVRLFPVQRHHLCGCGLGAATGKYRLLVHLWNICRSWQVKLAYIHPWCRSWQHYTADMSGYSLDIHPWCEGWGGPGYSLDIHPWCEGWGGPG